MTLVVRITRDIGPHHLDVDLEVATGERLVIVGPNAAGKTSLLRSIIGLDPAGDGRVALGSEVWHDSATGADTAVEARRVGFVPQHPTLLAHLDALANVAYGPRSRGAGRAESRAIAMNAMETLAVDHLSGRRPDTLSGGEAQRVAIARALAIEPSLLVLDEPTSALDIAARPGMRALISTATAASEAPAVIVTHDAVDALTLGDRIAVLEQGRLTQVGTGRELAAAPRTPYVAELLGINLIRGSLQGLVLSTGAFELTVGAHDIDDGPAIATVRPRSISLHRSRPEGSPRNVWQSRVTSIDRGADRVRVRLTEPVEIVVDLTPAGLSAIGVGEGDEVWASVKASEVTVASG